MGRALHAAQVAAAARRWAAPSALLLAALLAQAATARARATPSAPTRRAAQDAERSVADSRLDHGRGLLAAGRLEDALAVFEQARAVAPDGDVRPRVWVARTWAEQGRVNDALDAADRLRDAGVADPALDYLYGMAWYFAARAKAERGARDASWRSNLTASAERLGAATGAAPDGFPDAFAPLAEVTFELKRLDAARAAARRSIELYPARAASHELLARIATAELLVARADPERAAEAEAARQTARLAWTRVVVLLGEPARGEEADRLGAAWHALGELALLAGDPERAAEHFASAVEWSPGAVQYARLATLLGPERFARAVRSGASARDRRLGDAPRSGAAREADATLQWWLGFALFEVADHAAAERAFRRALRDRPDFANAHFYLARIRFARADHAGAVDALVTHWRLDPADLLKSLQGDVATHAPLLRFLSGWARDDGRLDDAALLAEVAAEFLQRDAEAWANAARERLALAAARPTDTDAGRAAAREDREAALQSLARALALEPEDPWLQLETAELLHRGLGRDAERAAALYRAARDGARRSLAADGLDSIRRARLEALCERAAAALRELARDA